MRDNLAEIVGFQFGAAVDMLENTINACPDKLWDDTTRYHQFWHMAHHTLFWLDLYLTGSVEGFQPPEPFGLEELDPAGVIPERPYSKAEMLDYLRHCREKLRMTLIDLTEEDANRMCKVGRREMSYAELLLYNMRHVQHHTAQMNLILRQETNSAPPWVGRAQ